MSASASFTSGDQVFHERFGLGSVRLDDGDTVLVRFEHGIEECIKDDLSQVFTPLQAINLTEWHSPLEVITRAQAEAIQSVNDTWGVFALSRIQLLPHQLWVCRQVLASWPTRWLVADDVGLGKTIEAGLILSPVIARGAARRVLIICPASLVEQWQYRLRTMFDLRFTIYATEADAPRADFWNTHDQVIVSLQTLRKDSRERHRRFFEAEPWDALLVDEAHHLGADEKGGPTLGYHLIEQLVGQNLVRSIVFFTGTPHRGKNFGFLALLKLLRSDLFDPQKSLRDQLPRLRQVMIRNNKQNVTDLTGKKLFFQPNVTPETYSYSEAEKRFYAMLTEFILTGKAYASSLSSNDGRAVMLVLTTMQKLASSSVAAIRRALRGRLARIGQSQRELKELQARLSSYEELEQLEDFDRISELEEQIAELSAELRLMKDEETRLRELVAAAELVIVETKITRIVSILENRFASRPVLFFTEYKATQSLLMSALIQKFGDECVTFINGDNRADDVVDSRGQSRTIYEIRDTAAEKFNSGEVRFLVSTEAGGEGIDLQENCYTLIHVDLPWNPMRLHQRVGRLNRYGQTRQVEVITLRNPDTVEAIIWDKLNSKIANITLALGQVMDDPEDLLQLILGMTSSSLFREVFTEAADVPRESLAGWFDQKTARFGGQDAIETVRALVGHCTRFDFQQISSQIPQLDLPALRPFLISVLNLSGRKVQQEAEGAVSFITPEDWLKGEPGIRTRYTSMVFDRKVRSKDAMQRILGVGHKVIDKAIQQAKASSASVATLPADVLARPLFIFRLTDRITGTGGTVRTVVAGIEMDSSDEQTVTLLSDWKLLEKLNELTEGKGIKRAKFSARPENINLISQTTERARMHLESQLEQLDLPFKIPLLELWAILWPIAGPNTSETDNVEGDED
ncbi:MAG: DEAD/DEAH box helicase [Anaerolineae bacterium]|nr:DEAD/DEAH box helicase [Anaerolineae bacterium]